MSLFNVTGIIGQVAEGLTVNVTGSLFLTLLFIVTGLVVVLLMFRVPLVFQAILLTPILLTLMALTGEFLAFGGVALILMGATFAITIAKSA